ncbi:Alpha-1,4 glucan phosphorylase L-2 isozyme, chloroplastic/amyloplastic [Vitis vinifera]|uniref:Alpha-1,4 glucan phosphorylase n=1 Tax=Vitis vinifera TaxID=29760 RepID=A0A438J0T0_VITVI|nr:Alpha-1,4 glucan phosphorylase L-2 isozyme, chloroplastic/amyloplastic [Vitis vinifera]
MAASPFSATSTQTSPFSHSNSFSSFLGFKCRSRHSWPFFIRTSSTWHSRRSLSIIRSVASNQKQTLKDPPTQEVGTSLLYKFFLHTSHFDERVADGLDSFAPDSASIASSIKYHSEFTPLFSPGRFELPKAYLATAQSVQDMLIINWNATYDYYEKMNVKQAYYLSMEYLQGRALLNAIGNLELSGPYAEALRKLGHNLEDVASQEPDAALGNGGLGRLASCFLDSLATLNYPAWAMDLDISMACSNSSSQKMMGNPWEIVRNDVYYPVKFYGKVIEGPDGKKEWIGGEDITAVAYDVPIPGYKTKTTINLRLWSTKLASEAFDLQAFNTGDHAKAYKAQKDAEKICYVLYPGDESIEGKTLRLKQQYTLCSASLQDIIRRFERRSGGPVNWENFPEKNIDGCEGIELEGSMDITQRTVAYTNHTVLPEALEKWSLNLLKELLPRHVQIIEMIDEELIQTITSEYGVEDLDLLQQKLKQMRILDNVELPSSVLELLVKSEEKGPAVDTIEETETSNEGIKPSNKKDELDVEESETEEKVTFEPDLKPPEMVRMANLCVVGGRAVNGVAEIHSEIVKTDVFNDFYGLWPEKFQNKTNGVTPRRWIRFCNPDLSNIITKWTGTEDWVINTEKLAELRKTSLNCPQFADNEDLQSEWREAKRRNKIKAPLACFNIKSELGNGGSEIDSDLSHCFQVKRIHEYKRQLLNIMGIVYRYKKMKEMSPDERKANFVPRVCIFGGKAFATYVQAKRIVKFITDVGATVNHDPDIGDLLKVVFVPDYNVSVAEVLIPGSELSQHISTAGMEASGTSNMKFAMNGCILIGTLDGANVEIREEVGEDNFFLFGARADEIAGLRKERAEGKFVPDPRFEEVKAYVRSGVFGPYNYEELMGSLEGNEGYGRADYFLVGKDFPSYIECQEKVDEAYRDQKKWTKMSILNTAGSYKFSSDRTIHEYARHIWMIDPIVIP